jgi:hypothetical protein
MTIPMKPLVMVGDVIHVAEPDYCYGLGFLHLRVTEVGPSQRQQDGDWVSLVGLTLRPDGSQLTTQPRHALVRVAALRKRPGR